MASGRAGTTIRIDKAFCSRGRRRMHVARADAKSKPRTRGQ